MVASWWDGASLCTDLGIIPSQVISISSSQGKSLAFINVIAPVALVGASLAFLGVQIVTTLL
jgi:hypothetical protein